MGENDVLTVAEAAEILKVNPRHVYNLCAHGNLPHARVGKNIRILREDLLRWLKNGGYSTNLVPAEGVHYRSVKPERIYRM